MTTLLAAPSSFSWLTNRDTSLRSLRPGVLLTTDFPPALGGISNYLFHLYRQFDLRQMTLVAPRHSQSDLFDSQQTYSAMRFRTAPNVPGLRGGWQLWRMHSIAERLIKQDRNLILHCGHVNAAIAARKIKRRYGTPYLLWTYALEIMDEWLRSTILPAMLDADLIITISEFTRAFLESSGVPSSRIVKIRPGTDPAHFRPALDCGDLARRLGVAGRPTLLTVARMVKANRYKGHNIVLRALPSVVRAIPNLAYLIVGEGDDVGYLQQLAGELGVRNNVVFVGRVSDAELPLLYNVCDAFIMCSREDRSRRGILAEGFGIALIEASACGKPVIAGRSGGTTEAVQDDITGLLVNPVDPEAVAATIIRVLQDRALAQRLGSSGRQWVESEMNWTRAADEFQRAMGQFFPTAGNEAA